jgi:hypothetical protein
MRKIALALATGSLIATGLIAGPAAAKPKLSGEEQLAKVLEGRVAGEPVDCISLMDTREQRVIDKTAIVYGQGGTIYVNRPRNASDLDRDDVMVSDIRGSQLCSVDVVRMHDRSNFFYTGFVGLDRFVPYRRVARAN